MLSHGTPIELAAAIDGVPHAFGGTVQRSTDEVLGFRVVSRKRDWPFPVGTEVHVDAVERCEVVSFVTSVTGLFPLSESLIVEVSAPDSVTTDQRSFFRLTWRVPFSLRWDGPAGAGVTLGETDDVGGGGVGMVIGEQVAVGDSGDLTLRLGDHGELTGRVTATKVKQVALSDPPRFRIGLAFDALPPKQRERLIRFIFEKQREIRRHEMA